MSNPCNFKRTENNWWECVVCGYLHQRPSNRAPVRKCIVSKPRVTTPNQEYDEPANTHIPKQITIPQKKAELGDKLEQLLTSVGITSDRVTKWLGRPCGCKRRREKLNQLDRWVRQFVSGEKEEAKNYLEQMIDE